MNVVGITNMLYVRTYMGQQFISISIHSITSQQRNLFIEDKEAKKKSPLLEKNLFNQPAVCSSSSNTSTSIRSDSSISKASSISILTSSSSSNETQPKRGRERPRTVKQ